MSRVLRKYDSGVRADADITGPWHIVAAVRQRPQIIAAMVGKIDDHYHVVARPSLIPAVECEKLVGVVDVVHVHVLSLQASCGVEPIAPQPNQVAVEGPDALESIALRPIELTCIRPGARLQEFLPHEDHGNTGDGK